MHRAGEPQRISGLMFWGLRNGRDMEHCPLYACDNQEAIEVSECIRSVAISQQGVAVWHHESNAR